jgi:hypothetical protein
MRANRNVQLPPEIWSRISQAATAEGKSVDEIIEEAASRLLQVRALRSFVAENQELALQRGLTESDVPRLIAETREHRSKG